MPGAVRLGDKTTGHSCWPPTQLATASSDTIINGIGSVRISDNIIPHCCPAGCHGGIQSSGSSNVNVNGNPIARIGDNISCGDMNAEGSSNVIIN